MTGISFILVIWTTVAVGGPSPYIRHDWRPIGEFHQDTWERKYSAYEMCQNAARELGLKTENYRCVRSR